MGLGDKIHLEINFEEYITKKLLSLQDGGWKVSENDNGYSAESALYFQDFLDYINSIEPKTVFIFSIFSGSIELM